MKRQFENTASIALNDRTRADHSSSHGTSVLAPIGHAIVLGISVAIITAMIIITIAAFLWSLEIIIISVRTYIFFFLLAVTVGCIMFTVTYIRRDRTFRTPSAEGQGDDAIDISGSSSQPIGTSYLPPTPADQLLRVSDTMLVKLAIPAEWGIDGGSIQALALKIYNGDQTWSRRALTGIVPEERYKDFSLLLVARGLLVQTVNNTFALTQGGILAFTKLVVDGGGTGVPPS